jgi:hypothetical protein
MADNYSDKQITATHTQMVERTSVEELDHEFEQ